MRSGKFLKNDWSRVDEILRAEIKKTLNVPQEAANEYITDLDVSDSVFFPIAAEESDLSLIDSAFKLQTTMKLKALK